MILSLSKYVSLPIYTEPARAPITNSWTPFFINESVKFSNWSNWFLSGKTNLYFVSHWGQITKALYYHKYYTKMIYHLHWNFHSVFPLPIVWRSLDARDRVNRNICKVLPNEHYGFLIPAENKSIFSSFKIKQTTWCISYVI